LSKKDLTHLLAPLKILPVKGEMNICGGCIHFIAGLFFRHFLPLEKFKYADASFAILSSLTIPYKT